MIVKFEDAEGVSFFDGVFMLTQMKGEKAIRMSQVVPSADPPVAVRDFDHGTVTCYGDGGTVIALLNLDAGAIQ